MSQTCFMCGSQTDRFPCPICGASPPGAPGAGGGNLAGGTVLRGRYRIDRFLAQGGMGSIYKAWDLNLEKDCILKEMLDQGAQSDRPQRVAQFRGEAEVLANLHHPHIAEVWDFFSENERYYIAEEFLPGGSLDQHPAPVAEPVLLEWAVQIAEALDYLHRRQIIYRDLKPDNILLRADGRAVLADFGIARFFKPGKQGDTQIALTIGYAPLEQMSQSIQTSPASDVYAFGATMYRLLTGKPPEVWLTALNYTEFPPLRSVAPAVSAELAAVAERCVRPRISDRYPDGAALLAALQPLRQSWRAALCRCGQQNPPGTHICGRCRTALVKPSAWQAVYPGPFQLKGGHTCELAWQTPLDDVVRGTPLLWGGKIYVAGKSGQLHVLSTEGRIESRVRLGGPSRSSPVYAGGIWTGTETGLSGPPGHLPADAELFAPPCPAAEGLYVLDHQGGLTALNTDLTVRWRRQLQGEGIIPPVHTGRSVIAMTKLGSIACFELDGRLKWQALAGEGVYGWPCLAGQELIFLDDSGRLQRWNAADGRRLSVQQVVGRTRGGLAAGQGRWAAADQQGLVVALDQAFAERWRCGVQSEVIASPIIAGQWVVVPDMAGKIHFLDLDTGREKSGAAVRGRCASPLVADGNALIGVTLEGVAFCLVSNG